MKCQCEMLHPKQTNHRHYLKCHHNDINVSIESLVKILQFSKSNAASNEMENPSRFQILFNAFDRPFMACHMVCMTIIANFYSRHFFVGDLTDGNKFSFAYELHFPDDGCIFI